MGKKCYVSNCKNQAEFKCTNHGNKLSCYNHFKDHLLLKTDHNIKPIISILDEKMKKKLLLDYKSQITSLNRLINFSKTLSEKMIQYLIRETNTFIKKVELEKKQIKQILISSLEKNMIDDDDLSFFNYFVNDIYDPDFYTNRLKEKIKDIYDIAIRTKKLQDNLMFFDNGNQFKVINLESLCYVSSKIVLPQTIDRCSAVSLGLDRFLIYGSECDPKGIVKILDFRKGLVESYPDFEPCNQSAMCLYEDNAFVFGGDDPTTEKCKKLDLKTMKWSSLASLPIKAGSTTASLHNHMIYVSGWQFSDIYEYNIKNNSFNSVVKIEPVNSHKLLVEDWLIVCVNSLYKFENFKTLNKKQSISLKDDAFRIFKGFRRKQYIYIVFRSNKIYRIETEAGKIEEINFN